MCGLRIGGRSSKYLVEISLRMEFRFAGMRVAIFLNRSLDGSLPSSGALRGWDFEQLNI